MAPPRQGSTLRQSDAGRARPGAVQTVGRVAGAHFFLEPARERLEHLSTGGMAVRVVVRLEMIDVEHGDAVAVLVTGHAGLEEFEILFERPAVTQSGERVLTG